MLLRQRCRTKWNWKGSIYWFHTDIEFFGGKKRKPTGTQGNNEGAVDFCFPIQKFRMTHELKNNPNIVH